MINPIYNLIIEDISFTSIECEIDTIKKYLHFGSIINFSLNKYVFIRKKYFNLIH